VAPEEPKKKVIKKVIRPEKGGKSCVEFGRSGISEEQEAEGLVGAKQNPVKILKKTFQKRGKGETDRT